jgi:hypothetical protein
VPVRREEWGCHKRTRLQIPTFVYEEEGVTYRYWMCPWNFVPDSILQFFEVYRYYKDFPSAPMPDIYDVSGRFIIAARYYEARINEYTKQLSEGK